MVHNTKPIGLARANRITTKKARQGCAGTSLYNLYIIDIFTKKPLNQAVLIILFWCVEAILFC